MTVFIYFLILENTSTILLSIQACCTNKIVCDSVRFILKRNHSHMNRAYNLYTHRNRVNCCKPLVEGRTAKII